MTVLESTVSMLNRFSERDLLKIQSMIRIFFTEEHQDNPFRLLSKDDVLRELTYSRQLAEEGKLWDAESVCENIEHQYGI